MTGLNTAQWRKATASSANNACVEVAVLSTVVGVRDTKNREGGRLELRPATWAKFLGTLR